MSWDNNLVIYCDGAFCDEEIDVPRGPLDSAIDHAASHGWRSVDKFDEHYDYCPHCASLRFGAPK